MEFFFLGLSTAFFGSFVTASANTLAARLFGGKKKATQSSANVVVVFFILN